MNNCHHNRILYRVLPCHAPFSEHPDNAAFNLPEARTDASSFTANGAIYLVGGTDGGTTQPQLYWAVPDPTTAFLRLTGLSLLFPKSRMASYNLTYLPEDEISEVDSVMGAFLLIRREAMDQVGFLDEDYFMYGEDLDWCFRVKASGWRVVYAPITRVIHHKGSASRKVPRLALLEFHRAMAIFYDKHYRAHYGFFMNFFVKFGIWGRYLLKSLGNMLRREKYVSK